MQYPKPNRRIVAQHGRRTAFTILELILVLAVIVALAGVSWPRMSGLLKRESILGNVEQVRQLLDHARVKAVEAGITYQFRYEPNGQKYILLPYEPQESLDPSIAVTTNSVSTNSNTVTAAEVSQALVQELSEDCYFYSPTVLAGEPVATERLPEPWLAMVRNGSQYRDVSWSTPILYSPNGSATDGQVTVADQDRRYLTLTVRGLTGAVVTSRIAQLPELFGASSN